MSSEQSTQPAIIYCRVSSVKQTTEGNGLGSQETRCREYARFKGLGVIQVFSDDMSGSRTDRPGMQAMLSFLRKHKKKQQLIVIIDDISRLARGIEAHLKLRADIAQAGGVLKSPSIEFGEDSDSILVENLLASVSQHQREKNGEQTYNRMRARAMSGYWCFRAPTGYAYARVPGHGKMLLRHEPMASIIQEALEGYASGRFQSQTEVKRFLESWPAFTPGRNDHEEIRYQFVITLLTRPVYAGYVEAPDWNIALRKGHHEGLISLATYERIQERLQEKAKAPARKDINADFPLRGFVCCADCAQPMTACWSKSRSGARHPYYLCQNRGCASKGKSVRRDHMQTQFEELLGALQPTANLTGLVSRMFRSAWDQRVRQAVEVKAALKRNLKEVESQIDRFLERIVETDSASVITAYESKIARLDRERLALTEKIDQRGGPAQTFEELFEPALQFLSNPQKLWVSGQLHLQRMVLRMAFAEPIHYRRDQGFSNPKTALPFKLLGDLCAFESDMVP